MKIGIIGSGSVAQTLALGFAAEGHDVRLATREPARLADFLAANPAIATGSAVEVAGWAEIAVLSVKGTAAIEALAPVGGLLAGKVVIDTTNPIADVPPDNGVLRYFTSGNDSLGERIQAAYPGLRLVKAFNSVGAAHMIKPVFKAGRPAMFIAGNDTAAKTTVSSFLDAFGWDSVDMGSIVSSRAIEPLCQLWCLPGFIRNDWNHAFAYLAA